MTGRAEIQKSLFKKARPLEFVDLLIPVAEATENLPRMGARGATRCPVFRRCGRIADRVAQLPDRPAAGQIHLHDHAPRRDQRVRKGLAERQDRFHAGVHVGEKGQPRVPRLRLQDCANFFLDPGEIRGTTLPGIRSGRPMVSQKAAKNWGSRPPKLRNFPSCVS